MGARRPTKEESLPFTLAASGGSRFVPYLRPDVDAAYHGTALCYFDASPKNGPAIRLNVVWHQVGDNKYAAGILLWREY